MGKSKSAKQGDNLNIPVRRSERLSDKFKKLPDDLILKILSNIQYDSKTLIRCSSVSKHFHSLVSKTETVFVRYPLLSENGESIPCRQKHHHTPAAVSRIRKVFTNLKSLNIKLCNYVLPPTSDGGYMVMMKGVLGSNGDIHVKYRVAFEIGLLTRETTRLDDPLVLDLNFLYFQESDNFLLIDQSFLSVNHILPHFFNGLCSMAISSGKVRGPGFSGGRLFMRKDQVLELSNLISHKSVYESWIRKPENVLYWLKDLENENCISEKVWLVEQWESHGTNEVGEGTARHFDVSRAMERDVKELLVAIDVVDDYDVGH